MAECRKPCGRVVRPTDRPRRCTSWKTAEPVKRALAPARPVQPVKEGTGTQAPAVEPGTQGLGRRAGESEQDLFASALAQHSHGLALMVKVSQVEAADFRPAQPQVIQQPHNGIIPLPLGIRTGFEAAQHLLHAFRARPARVPVSIPAHAGDVERPADLPQRSGQLHQGTERGQAPVDRGRGEPPFAQLVAIAHRDGVGRPVAFVQEYPTAAPAPGALVKAAKSSRSLR